MDWTDDGYCFCCGRDNPIGLKLRFIQNGGEILTHFTPQKVFQGYAGILHGGILSTIMDELMAHVVIAGGELAATVKMEIIFKQPARIGEKLTFRARLVESKKKFRELEAKAENEKGEIIAQASAIFMVVGKKSGSA